MNTEVKSPVLTAIDRCDLCDSRAYVLVKGISGELTFCSHHFSKIDANSSAKEALLKFAYEIIDERDFLYS